MIHGRAAANSDGVLKNLTTLIKGLFNRVKSNRDKAEMQLSNCLHPNGIVGMDMDDLMRFLINKGCVVPCMVTTLRAGISEWMVLQQSATSHDEGRRVEEMEKEESLDEMLDEMLDAVDAELPPSDRELHGRAPATAVGSAPSGGGGRAGAVDPTSRTLRGW